MYQKVDFKNGFVPLEHEVLDFWKNEGIIGKSFARNPEGEFFTFYDGPPTANGKPHIGHVLTRAIKDLIPRYKVMRGYQVLRKAGWDTHGLPVELEIEKQLGIKNKSDIEAYGVEKFIEKCKSSVFEYVGLWEDMSNKVGYWVDMEHPYVTYHNNYIESVWWALKTLWEKDLIYKGHKVMPYCTRCGTALSSHEVAQGYKDVTDISAIAKFKLLGKENTYVLAWTTTPWTLPSNTALTLGKDFTYVEARQDGELYILAKELLSVLGDEETYEVLREFKGEELLGMSYEQLLPFEKPDGNAFKILHGDYVTLSDGTGIVHTAPAYGEEDNLIGKANGIATLHLVDLDGKFVDSVTPFAGMHVRDANPKIVEYLAEAGKLYKSEKFKHSYPHCWRCDEPLLYYPKDSWFVKSTAYRDKLLENNNMINWYPENIGTGRFGKFLENVIDWSISRDRYWGTPLPIWECDCGHREMIGSVAELHEKGIGVPDGIELHKPYIDDVKLTCPECSGTMMRVHEVIDGWFDSGSMPFAQHHYPFENKEVFENNFPAQFISEAVDQTRGWFYTLLNLSTALFDKPAFENCIVMGHILDKKGIKQSKSKGNAIEPNAILDTTGADAMRWHFYSSGAPWLSKRLSVDDVVETQRKFMLTLSNVYSFYVLYADLDNFNPAEHKEYRTTDVMDRWILSKLHSMITEVETNLDGYQIPQSAEAIETFVDELSNWYVRRNRARFWKGELDEDKISAFMTLNTVLTTLSVTLAPFIPFFAETMYQSLVRDFDDSSPESVHLCDWISPDATMIDRALETEMGLAYTAVRLGRAARNSANIKNRQPLAHMKLSANNISESYKDMIKEELNIKEVDLGADISGYVSFDIKPNLPVLGKEFGRYIPKIKAAIAAHDQMELASLIQAGGETTETIENGIVIPFNADTLLISMNGLDGFAFAGNGDMGVVLETTITEELANEGYIREVLSKVQNMRKDSGFEVSDHITLHFGGNEKLISLIKDSEDFIKGETLADTVSYDDAVEKIAQTINGETLMIAVKKA